VFATGCLDGEKTFKCADASAGDHDVLGHRTHIVAPHDVARIRAPSAAALRVSRSRSGALRRWQSPFRGR
jgi:hypothetical protein